jgi:hypothetical protein
MDSPVTPSSRLASAPACESPALTEARELFESGRITAAVYDKLRKQDVMYSRLHTAKH